MRGAWAAFALAGLAWTPPAAADSVLDQLQALQRGNMDRVYQERRDQQVMRLDQARPIFRYDQTVHNTDRALDRLHDFPPADRPAAETNTDAEINTLQQRSDEEQRLRLGR